ncbi:hypothetical protein HNQ72_005416 [Rhizobium wenxiniae]|uniref:Uncharacterized protein n=1 Tax=Rhizobium wenxiniae TaxID=1737357 RepID=A0A7X0D2Z1_9HYPH|nr:hypothetical protein [Rhizobium wenxiniae]
MRVRSCSASTAWMCSWNLSAYGMHATRRFTRLSSHDLGDEGDLTAEPVQLSNQQFSAGLPGKGERFGKFRAIVFATRSNVLIFSNDFVRPFGKAV